jgi:hypothetical protein
MEKSAPSEKDETLKTMESGFSWRSIMGILYAVSVFQGAAIFIYLMTANIAMFAGLQWATLLLFAELTRIYGHPLTKQEAAVIYMGSSLVSQFIIFMAFSGAGLPMGWLYQAYVKFSPVTASFNMADKIPSFYSPPVEVWIARTFFHPAWIPIATVTFIWFVCALTSDICLGLIVFNLYALEEKLPFPLAQPIAQACTILTSQTEEAGKKLRMMMVIAAISFIYAIILYGANFIWMAWGFPSMGIPIPWFDFNRTLHLVLPGVSFGVATDAALFATGFIIPFPICAAIFMGSFAIYFVGNMILVLLGITGFAEEWAFGMSVADSWQRSILNVWAVPIIGASIAIGLIPLLRRPKALVSTLKSLTRVSPAKGIGVPLAVPLALFLIASSILSFYSHTLSPAFPLWLLLLLNVGWSFIYALIAGRASGVAMPFTVPYLRELTFALSGYPAYDIWFVPVYTSPSTAWVTDFKVCELTQTNPLSYVKALLLMWPVAFILGFFITQSFWSMNPIPSLVYPGVEFSWPITNSIQMLFVTRAEKYFRFEWLSYGFIITAALYLILDLFHAGYLMIGAGAGLITPIPNAAAIFIGSILGYIIAYIRGEKWWNENKAIIAAGVMLGEGVLLVIATAVAIIIRSLYALPY